MAAILKTLAASWPFFLAISGFFLGCLFTRMILTPRYCPRCRHYLSWRLQTRAEADKAKKEREPWEAP
jgi:hypothetical protein